jgi:DNA-binding CsgD family transcriptional regulator
MEMSEATLNWVTVDNRSAIYTYTTEREYYEQRAQEMRQLRKDGATLQQISDIYGVSRERVRQVIGNTKDFHYVKKAREQSILNPTHLHKTDQELADELGVSVYLIQRYRSGIRRKVSDHSHLGKGVQIEEEVSGILRINRINHTLMPPSHPFDILLENGKRVDVKSAHKALQPPSQRYPFYWFSLKKDIRGEYADFFILAVVASGYIDELYVVPNSAILRGSHGIRIGALPPEQRKSKKGSKYSKYLNRFDLLK